MNKTLAALVKPALVTLLLSAAPGCLVQPESDETYEDTTEATEAVCAAPSIIAAAILKQITNLDMTVNIQIVTISAKPYQMSAYWVSGLLPGASLQSLTSSCTPSGANNWRCAHDSKIDPGAGCTATGAYTIFLKGMADAGSGCPSNMYGPRVDFWLTTENLCGGYEIDG